MKPYFQEDGITIFHGDCREILPALSPAGLILTDPPYESEAHTLGRRGNTARDGDGAFFATRELTFAPIDEETRIYSGTQMARLSQGWILVFCQVEAAMLWRDALVGAKYMRTQIWRKPNGAPQFTGDRPGMGYESIVTAWAGEGRSHWNGGGRHGVYEANTVQGGSGHQTEKPLSLILQLISLFSDHEQSILDPFMGSGTTLRAAKDLGRQAIGIEIEEKYCEMAAKRCAQKVFAW